MKKLLFFLAIFCTLQANAQRYSISFSGTGLSTVKVQNLTTGFIVDVPAGDVLRLSIPTGIPEVNNMKSFGLKVYPNPMTDKSTLEILPPIAGDAIISVCDMTGKVLTQFKGYLENYIQEFSLSGIRNGLHIINVQGNGYQFSEKLLSNGRSNGTAIIARVSNNIQAITEKKSIKDSKGVQATVDMAYNTGERLKYTAVSGNNSTVMTDIPTADKTFTFTFTECKDGENNYYPVVQINTQLWMAENLKTTKYNDGTAIPNITVDATWSAATTGAYSDYNNTPANSTTYGRLYNWYAVDNNAATKVASNGGKNVCPTSWFVPTYTEWKTLTTYLGGESVAGGKLKETGTTHWITPNTGATNETGFTALPGGHRLHYDGLYYNVEYEGDWWSSTELLDTNAWSGTMDYGSAGVGSFNSYKQNGFSVRCVRDKIIETEAAINDSLELCYSKLHDYTEFTFLFDAVYANKVTAPNSSWNDIYNHSQSLTNQKVLMLWLNGYEIIYKANLVILSATQVISDPSTRDQVIAQAKTIRAYLFYNLMTWFGEIPLEVSIYDRMNPRNSIEEVLTQIKQDATESSLTLPMSWPVSDEFRIPQSFAKGLLARASLYSKNYTEALTPTQQIINSGEYTLSADTNNFTAANTEIFWGFEKGDNTEFNVFFHKGSYVPVIRYTESYLVSAEAYFNLGQIDLAVSYINPLIIRRGGTPITAVDLTKDVIYKHWRTELAKEGSMFITLKRFDKALSIVQDIPDRLVLPVPMNALIFNPYLTQNPGY